MENKNKNKAIVLAGGRGSRMNSPVKKQYMLLGGRPLLYYSLKVFQDSPLVDEIILVCAAEDIEMCRTEIVEPAHLTKVKHIVRGGAERYHSVYEGLKAAGSCSNVLIHDGARPFVEESMLERIMQTLQTEQACVVGVPVKDTIKLSDQEGYIAQTLPREQLWTIQTPQSFSAQLIRGAYDRLAAEGAGTRNITDDAMVAECFGSAKIRLIEGSYENIKITTPEDLQLAEQILARRQTH